MTKSLEVRPGCETAAATQEALMSEAPGTIVVGIDGSESSDHALDWAADQAVLEQRALTLVYGLGIPTPAWTDIGVADPYLSLPAIRTGGQAEIDQARARVARRAPALDVLEVLELEDPRTLLLEQSKRAALVVLGSRGRGPVRSALLGSVGVAVARHTSCPVVIHRPVDDDRERRGILVADDATRESLPVLEFAYRQAEVTKLPLTVMHCYWDIPAVTTPSYAGSPVDLESERRELAESLAGLATEHPDVEVREVVEHGLPEVRVPLATDEMDLVVVGAHQGSRLQQLMYGAVSIQALEHGTCPVAVVPVGAPGPV
jgi:nucleotide-binding universal stress UspA family protein